MSSRSLTGERSAPKRSNRRQELTAYMYVYIPAINVYTHPPDVPGLSMLMCGAYVRGIASLSESFIDQDR
jgi:hypothetical protein